MLSRRNIVLRCFEVLVLKNGGLAIPQSMGCFGQPTNFYGCCILGAVRATVRFFLFVLTIQPHGDSNFDF